MQLSDSVSSPETKTRRIVLIDDHAILREGLRELLQLEADFKVVGEASSVRQGQTLTVQIAPDLVIIDVAIASDFGMSIIQAVKIHTGRFTSTRSFGARSRRVR